MEKPHLCQYCGEQNRFQFYKGEKSRCKSCHSANMQALQRTPKGWADNHVNNFMNRVKANDLITTLTSEQLLSKVKSTGGHCAHCDRQFRMPWETKDESKRKNKLEVDHILTIALAKEKGVVWNDINNIQILCKTCHKKKTAFEKRAVARRLMREAA